ncbi:hypothetical protein [Mandarin fish ranavirus]|nr:hypothetical protein [Mandarin fish ranavirus]
MVHLKILTILGRNSCPLKRGREFYLTYYRLILYYILLYLLGVALAGPSLG